MFASRHRDRVEGYIAKGRDEGARVVTGGGRPAGFDKGWYVEPTIFADVDNTMTIAQEEIFGPGPVGHPLRRRRRCGRASPTTPTTASPVRSGPATRSRASTSPAPGAHRHLRRERHGHGLLLAVRWLQGLRPRPRARPRGSRRVPRVEDHRPAAGLRTCLSAARSRIPVGDVAPAGVQTLAVDIHLPRRVARRVGHGRSCAAACPVVGCHAGTSTCRRRPSVGNFSMVRHLVDRGLRRGHARLTRGGGERRARRRLHAHARRRRRRATRTRSTRCSPQWPDAIRIGVGHSAGALLTVVQQARHRTYDALGLFGFGRGGHEQFALTQRGARPGGRHRRAHPRSASVTRCPAAGPRRRRRSCSAAWRCRRKHSRRWVR